MKGTIILKPLEYNIEAFGEKWHQGDKLKASLKIKNHSIDRLELPLLKLALCEGQYKKIKAKDIKGWTIIQETILAEKLIVSPSSEYNFEFEFCLPENSLITDKNGSLYLAFFDKDEKMPAGHIELVIEPKLVIKQTLQILENFLRFKIKEIKYVKGFVEVKFLLPSSREYSSIDGLLLSFSEVEKNLTMKYIFNLRSLDLTSGTLQVEKKIKEIERVFSSKQYLIFGDSINQDFIIESVQEVLSMVKTKII